MNIYFIIGVVVAIAMIVICIFLHRRLKSVARRCRCGKFRKRSFKIVRLPGEVISWRDGNGHLRLFIRDVVKLTFAECGEHGISLVKVDRDPISVWHALWVKRFHSEQYDIEEQTLFSVERLMPDLLGRRKPSDDQKVGDPPPVSLNMLLQDLLDDISELLFGPEIRNK